MIIKFIVGLFFSFMMQSTFSDSCRLIHDSTPVFEKDLGNISIDSIVPNNKNGISIILESFEGNRTGDFDFNKLYKITYWDKEYYFRFNYAIFQNGKTELRNVVWLNNKAPCETGLYDFNVYQSEKTRQFNRTMVTIGDSISWADDGRYLRCLLNDEGINYDFIGTKIDTFGFKHEAEGGDKTTSVINRLNSIPVADAYFLLLGTNDVLINLTPIETVNNLMIIAYELKSKNPEAKIYISTLLPRYTPILYRNLDVNSILKSNYWGSNIYILDIGSDMYYTTQWWTLLYDDFLHPNYQGYKYITNSIVEKIQHI